MSNGKPSSAPAGLQQVEVPMNPMRANRMAWAAFALGVVAIVANSLTGAGFVPKLAMQVCGWLAGLCTALSWYLARKTPSFESMKARASLPAVPSLALMAPPPPGSRRTDRAPGRVDQINPPSKLLHLFPA